ncbi:hypothetical protein DV737_g1387, partial [Chaetothyriales sp. CBS 132003]
MVPPSPKEDAAGSVLSEYVQEIPEKHSSPDQTGGLAQSIEAAFARLSRRVDDSTTDNEASEPEAEEEDRSVSQDREEHEFNCSWGYLPPLDDEAAAIIEAIIANPDMATTYTRIGPSHKAFSHGLRARNVFLHESDTPDPYADQIRLLTPAPRTQDINAETESHARLWALDQVKISRGSNEALFQRTLMMSLIGRHLFIYHRDREKADCLDFSVEEPWTCPPMPTRAYNQFANFLSQPKPDLAVCFRRETAIPDRLWNSLPFATQGLACYENIKHPHDDRIFHFLTIEAKKQKTSTDDDVGKHQSLNNASQALHNMFEFFREADHADIFFAKVRFFSVVASTEGLCIRIHRATREPKDGSDQGFIMPNRHDYPLRFEYQDFAHITRDEFALATVLSMFENILAGYGARILRDLIHNAAQAIVEKLEANPQAHSARGNPDFYRYDQIQPNPKSRILTPIPSRPESVREMSLDMTPATRTLALQASNQDFSQTAMSYDMMPSHTSTPFQSQPTVPKQTTRGKGKKRAKSPSPNQISTSRPERKRRNEQSFSSIMSE